MLKSATDLIDIDTSVPGETALYAEGTSAGIDEVVV
jgi:hypothetical protein